MGIDFGIIYHELVAKQDISGISTSDKKRIEKAIEEKLMKDPVAFGKPLRRSLKGYRKLRVGDYRVIFRIEKQNIKVFCIGHRSVVYEKIDKRI